MNERNKANFEWLGERIWHVKLPKLDGILLVALFHASLPCLSLPALLFLRSLLLCCCLFSFPRLFIKFIFLFIPFFSFDMPFPFSFHYFFLLSFFPLPSLFNQNHSPLVCPKVPNDVPKGREGEICYRRTNGEPSYFFEGKKIAGEPDSKIYKADKFKQGIGQAELDSERTFAVKVVSTGTSARAWFNDLEANKPVDEHSVVKLFKGETVEDKSRMVVEHEKLLPLHVELRRDFSMIYVMEFGDNTLDNYLKQWDELARAKQMGELQIKQDAEQLLAKLASTLSTFHRHAAHLHLKPGNWIFVRGENKWKLIDLQSAIPNFEQYKPLQMGKEERFPEDFMEFACNSLNNEICLTKFIAPANERPSTYASPEHSTACQRTRPLLSKWRHPFGKRIGHDQLTEMSAQLMQIGPKSDVWSFGVLMLEILAHTPQVNPADQRADALRIFVKIRAEFVSGIVAKDRMGMRQRIEEFAHFKGRRKKVRMDGQKLDTKLGKYMERIQGHFPAAFRALLKIFEKDKNKRAEISEIVDILSAKI